MNSRMDTHIGVVTDPDHDAVEHAAKMLAALGITGDERTAHRMVRALDELTRGRLHDPRTHLEVRFPPVDETPGLIAATDIPFVSVCEHHILPFAGVATVAYLPHPGDRIVGLSKLARLVVGYAARPQVQERLTAQVVSALDEVLAPAGAACRIRSVHQCMALRGARAGTDAAMITAQYRGALNTDPWRHEFRQLLSPQR